jgi:hypothetical protein
MRRRVVGKLERGGDCSASTVWAARLRECLQKKLALESPALQKPLNAI